MELIYANFQPLPIFEAPYYDTEVVGVAALSRLAVDCFGDRDPSEIFYHGALQELEELPDGGVVLRIPLPFVKGGDVSLRKRGDEMFVTVGNFKREMILPTVFAKRKATGGRLIEGVLEISFAPPEPEPDPEPEAAAGSSR
jgi:arsenite-transporting ATPase